jgi:alanine dehydrogenase
MPGAVPRTSTFALTNATLTFVLDIASKGLHGALQGDLALQRGVNTYNGFLINRKVAQAQGRDCENIDRFIR